MIKNRIKQLRKAIKNSGLDGYIIPRGDDYLGESVPEAMERLAFITQFTGSAGMAIVHKDKAAIFTDSRYDLQVCQEVPGDIFEIYNIDDHPPEKWIRDNFSKKSIIGYDPYLHTRADIDKWKKNTGKSGVRFKALPENLIDPIWQDRPDLPQSPVEIFPDALAGKTSAQKRKEIAKELHENDAHALVICQPESIAWLLNIRGHDVPHTPLILSRGVLNAKNGQFTWFIDESRLSDAARDHLGEDVKIKAPQETNKALKKIVQKAQKNGKSIQLDTKRSPSYFADLVHKQGAKVLNKEDPCLLPRAIKTPEEQHAMRQAHIVDGAALVRFLYWLDQEIPTGSVSELSASQRLYELRKNHPDFVEPSFETISGFRDHGAIVHYRVTKEKSQSLEGSGLYLVDSGGQYFGDQATGTTDITRTIPVGKVSEREKRHFTRVLKGHFNLANARFPAGTTGAQIDTLARESLWEAGLDYRHGTGHGVGCYLAVHEESANLGPKSSRALESGMILSNEPGYYEKDSHGIRIENLILVRDTGEKLADGRKILEFETLSLAPIDTRLVMPEMLDDSEKDTLNAYHRKVLTTLKGELQKDDQDKQVLDWLHDRCAPV